MTNEYSVNGNYSIHLIRSSEATNNTYLNIIPTVVQEDINKTLTLTADIYTPNNDASVQILHNNGYTGVAVSKNSNFQTATISKVITNIYNVRCFVNIFKQQDCYIDNVQITIV